MTCRPGHAPRLKAKVGRRLAIRAATPTSTRPLSQAEAKTGVSNWSPKIRGRRTSPPADGAGTPTKKSLCHAGCGTSLGQADVESAARRSAQQTAKRSTRAQPSPPMSCRLHR